MDSFALSPSLDGRGFFEFFRSHEEIERSPAEDGGSPLLTLPSESGVVERELSSTSELFDNNTLRERFKQYHDTIVEHCSTDSLRYSQNLAKMESVIRQIEADARDDSSKREEADTWKLIFQDLYTKMPNGKSLFLKSDLDRISRLYTRPLETTYSCKKGEFQVPKVTVRQILEYFNDFKNKWGYGIVDINMRSDHYFDWDTLPSMVTSITFKKNDSTKPERVVAMCRMVRNILSSHLYRQAIETQTEENSSEIERDELKTLVSKIVLEWGFDDRSERIILGDVQKDYQHIDSNFRKDLGSYVLLFHKQVREEV